MAAFHQIVQDAGLVLAVAAATFLVVCSVMAVYRMQGRVNPLQHAGTSSTAHGFDIRAGRLLDEARRAGDAFVICAAVPAPGGPLPEDAVRALEMGLRGDDIYSVPQGGGAWTAAFRSARGKAWCVHKRLADMAATVAGDLKIGCAEWTGETENVVQLCEKAVHAAGKSVLSSESSAAPLRELPGGWKDVVMPQEVDQALGRYLTAHEDDPRGVSVLHLDVDHFKVYGEQYGARVSADIVQQLGAVMRRSVRYTDFVAHVRDDEFLVLMPALPEQARCAVQRLLGVVRKTVFPTSGQELKITVSFGIASYPSHARTVDELRNLSGIALRAAKSRGRNTFALYEQSMAAQAAGVRSDTL